MLKLGKYLHHKGKIYEVIGEARHSETLEKLAVYLDEKCKMWVRPLKMFQEKVLKDGKKVPRFKCIER
jgi:hypothetical protein